MAHFRSPGGQPHLVAGFAAGALEPEELCELEPLDLLLVPLLALVLPELRVDRGLLRGAVLRTTFLSAPASGSPSSATPVDGGAAVDVAVAAG